MKGIALILVLASAIAVSDQLIKAAVVRILSPGESVPLISGFLYLSRVHNTGSAFGILQGQNLFLIVVVTLVVGYLVWGALRGHFPGGWGRVGMGLVLGGAFGNLMDRVARGYVVDYIDFRYFPAFNLADACVVLGALALGISILRGKGDEAEVHRPRGA